MKLLQCFPTSGKDIRLLSHQLTHTHAQTCSLILFLLYLLSEDAIVKSRLAEAIDAILTKAQVIQIFTIAHIQYLLYGVHCSIILSLVTGT